MILKICDWICTGVTRDYKKTKTMQSFSTKIKLIFCLGLLLSVFQFSTCKYGFKDVAPIPVEPAAY
jgi:hypothetical protein